MKKFLTKYKFNIILYAIIALILSLTTIWNYTITRALMLRPKTPEITTTSVHVVNVGQASCTLIHFASGEDMMIDSGEAGARTELDRYIKNVFFYNGDRVFEYVILTHSDRDHSGNMAYLMDKYKFINFYRPNIVSELAGESESDGEEGAYVDYTNEVYAQVISKIKTSNINVTTCKSGVEITNNGKVLLTMYSPEEGYHYSEVNDYSSVMIAGDESIKVCVTGDASSDVERVALNNYDLPKVDVLVLGHHGSDTSTAYEFLEAIQPDRVAISVGKNTYGHPSSATYDTLMAYDRDYNKSTYETKLLTLNDGNIIFYGTSSGYSVMCISTIANYLFIDYYVFVLIVLGVMIIVFAKPIYPNGRKNAKKKRIKHKTNN